LLISNNGKISNSYRFEYLLTIGFSKQLRESKRRGESEHMQGKIRITAQVLNGATGEVREVTANVTANNEQDAVNKLFAHARQDDFYYRFLGSYGVIVPTLNGATPLVHQTMQYWALEA
jgi:hypothetical protein